MHIRRTVRLSGLTLRVLGLFAVVEHGLRRHNLLVLSTRLGVRLRDSSVPMAPAEPAMSRRAVGEALAVARRVSRRWPWGDTCLRRSLVTGAVLSALQPTLVLGVRRTSSGEFLAHSWLEIDGKPITATSEDYERLAL